MNPVFNHKDILYNNQPMIVKGDTANIIMLDIATLLQ